MLFITLILAAGFTEGGNYPMVVVMLILLEIQVKGARMVEQNEFSKAALRGLTKYLMSKEKIDVDVENRMVVDSEWEHTDPQEAEEVLPKCSCCKKPIQEYGYEIYDELICPDCIEGYRVEV